MVSTTRKQKHEEQLRVTVAAVAVNLRDFLEKAVLGKQSELEMDNLICLSVDSNSFKSRCNSVVLLIRSGLIKL